MGRAAWSRRGVGALVVVFGIVLAPAVVRGQVVPIFPGTPAQTETAPAAGERPKGPQQPPGPVTPPGAQTPAAPGAQPVDPFAGSPLLRMFEPELEASAPLRQSRYAPTPEPGLPFNVRLFLTAEEEFTDNADQTRTNRKSEFNTRIVPGIAIGAERPWANLALSYAPQIFIENNTVGDTEVNQSLSARAALWPGGRFQLNIADDFTDSNDFRDQQDPGSRVTGTNQFTTNTVTAEAAYALPRLKTALAYTNTVHQTDVGFSDTRVTHSVRPSVDYTDPRFGISGSYTVTRGDENSSIEIPYWLHRGETRFSYALTPVVSAVVTGSYEYEEPDAGAHFSDGRGLVGGTLTLGPDGSLTLLAGVSTFSTQDRGTKVRPSESLTYTHRFAAVAVSARYEEGYENRSGAVDSTGVTFTRSAGIFVTTTALLFRQLTGTLGVRWTEEKFEQTSTFGGPPGTKDRTWDIDVSIRYLLARAVSIDLGYTATIRTSTQDSAEFHENRVRLGLRYEYTLF